MKTIKTALLGAILVMSISSCGYEISIQSTETTTTIPATTTTISYGKDCNKVVEAEIQSLRDVLSVAWDKRSGSNRTPTSKEARELSRAMRELRGYIRALDLPTMTVEQNAYVDAMENYLVAFNRYIESDKDDLSVNDYLVPLNDADDDFTIAWNEVCQFRSA